LSSTEEEITSVHSASAEDVDRAVRAAHKALKNPSWKRLPATERGMLMMKLADLMEQNKELLATIDAWDNGPYYLKASLDRGRN
jgi:aldehyde dehydrogenase (NAD+)